MLAIKIYRISNFFYERKIPLIPKLLVYFNYFLFNSFIPASTKIGKNSKFAYGGIGVVLHSKAIIGNRCIIGQGVTIGRKLSSIGIPIIGNDVYIAAGSRLLGDIKIGSNVIIGANSVVIHNIPDNCIIAGSPAKVVKKIDVSIYELMDGLFDK
ncbi:serine O-acetyltransferase [Acinetobacter bohemicus]|uniref:serine O-acetyltransferase n=1 Tax=Acinetobacter bohemicus TaxID=1435036 RepID=UPI00192A96A7|nr:serine acetyltransferase [Acinetobacter bohemicus]CAD9197677.1 Serine acetyltransferase [Acinetobacter bohemicus]